MWKHKISQYFKYVNNLRFVINISQLNYCCNFTTIMHNYFILYKPAFLRFTLNEYVCVCANMRMAELENENL